MRIEIQNEAGIWENLECEKCLNNKWETEDHAYGETAFRCLLCEEGSSYIKDSQWREKSGNVDVFSQAQWTRALNSNFVSELKHPYYRVDDEIRKVAENKADARAKFDLTTEQEESTNDAVIIDPMPEREVCREILDAALDEYLAFAALNRLCEND